MTTEEKRALLEEMLDCRLCAKWSGKFCKQAVACVEGDSFVRSYFRVAAWAKQKEDK